MALEVASDVIATLIVEAANAAPRECCGVLLGNGNHVQAWEHADNVSDAPEQRFEIDPAVLLAAHRAARSGGPEVVGYYHSHPGGHPRPSATDCEHASGDRRVWAIIADGAVTFWRDGEHGFEPLSYVVVDG